MKNIQIRGKFEFLSNTSVLLKYRGDQILFKPLTTSHEWLLVGRSRITGQEQNLSCTLVVHIVYAV